jgi:hypothetical protein
MQEKWEDYGDEFDFDGSWRDIYVLGTSVPDWQAMVEFLSSGVYEYSFSLDGETANLPACINDLFDIEWASSGRLEVRVGSVWLNCHFFTESEIEFDLDPRDVKSSDEAEQVFDFMVQLGHLLSKEVILTPENCPQIPLFKFAVDAERVVYIPIT